MNQNRVYRGGQVKSDPYRNTRSTGMKTVQRRSRRRVSPASIFLFSGIVLYSELLLRLFDSHNAFWRAGLFRSIFFSLAAGIAIYLLLSLIRNRKARQVLMGVFIGFGTVLTCVEYCCKSFFKTYFGLGYILNMTGHVAQDFAGSAFEVAIAGLPFIILSLVPGVALLLFKDRMLPTFKPDLTASHG